MEKYKMSKTAYRTIDNGAGKLIWKTKEAQADLYL